MTFRIPPRGVFLLRWCARLGSLGLTIFFGAFLVEHVSEWVVGATERPPAWVLGTLVAHATMMLGWLIGWRWELAGAILSLLSMVFFLPGKVQANSASVLTLAAMLPGCLWLFLSGYRLGQDARTPEPG